MHLAEIINNNNVNYYHYNILICNVLIYKYNKIPNII